MAASAALRGVRDQEVVAPHLGWLTAKLLANRSAVARQPQNRARTQYCSPSADGRFPWGPCPDTEAVIACLNVTDA